MGKALDYETALEAFCKRMQLRGLAATSIDRYQVALKSFENFLKENGHEDLRNMTTKEVKCYQKLLMAQSMSPSTKYMNLSVLSYFFKFLFQQEWILVNPVDGVLSLKKPSRKLPVVLTEEEVERLFSAPFHWYFCGLRDRAILELFYSSGLRKSELVNLHISDIKFKKGTVVVRQGKGGKDRVLPVGERALFWLKKYLQELRPRLQDPSRKLPYLFLRRDGFILNKWSLCMIIRKYALAAGITKRFYPHLLRHTMATHFLKKGASIRIVQEMLGHVDLRTTQLYAQVEPTSLKKIYSKYHPRGQWEGDHGTQKPL